MWGFIILVLICWAIFSPPYHDHCWHCHHHWGGFFFPHGCDRCAENEGCGCLTLIIGAIIFCAIFC